MVVHYVWLVLIECLFPNIPLNKTINNCVSDLHNKILYNEKLSKRDLFKLLETATSESSFIFDELLYKQVDGGSHSCKCISMSL